MRKYKIQLLVLVLILSLLSACAAFNKSVNLTPKQQSTIWMVVYNSIYDDTMAMAKNPAITPAQKDLVAKKKAILTQVWPLLKIYVGIVETGGVPTLESAQAISDLITQLAALAGGKS